MIESCPAMPAMLPGGLWLEGVCYREAWLRPLAGSDEGFLSEMNESLLTAQRATALLARCLIRVGPLDAISTETVRWLTIGDREALLLHLRQLTLGERLQCILTCPHTGCGAKMDLELKVSDLLLPPYPHYREGYEVIVNSNGTAFRVRFRLPKGIDQEEAASLARDDPQAAAGLLLGRCVDSVTAEEGNGGPIADWPTAVSQQLPAIMAELDPQAEVTLSLSCPACRQGFSVLFDTATYFFKELAGRVKHLYQEVHTLALYYHWSEAEIMGMTARKRGLYLDLLSDNLSEQKRR